MTASGFADRAAQLETLDYGLAGYDEIESRQFGALLRLPFREPDRSSPRHAPNQEMFYRRNHA